MQDNSDNRGMDTKDDEYADLLKGKQRVWWKQLLVVQMPYRWNIRRLRPGFVLDIGCGIGRNLLHLNGHGVGIDHNKKAVGIAKESGLKAFTPEEFQDTTYIHQQFDSLLLSHVAEHMTQQKVVELLSRYLYLLRLGGKLIMITPQEIGYNSDLTHVEFMDFSKLSNISRQLGLITIQEYSFPFPRFAGRVFTFNEFISVSRKTNT